MNERIRTSLSNPDKEAVSPEGLRNEAEVNTLIATAITDVIEAFRTEMSERDSAMLTSVINDDLSPQLRVSRLVRLPATALHLSEDIKGYINQILQTLREQLTDSEKEKFRTWSRERSLLEDIN